MITIANYKKDKAAIKMIILDGKTSCKQEK